MSQKKATKKLNKTSRQTTRQAQNQQVSMPKLFTSIILLLILGSVAVMLHRSPDNSIRLNPNQILPSLPLFPSPTPLAPITHVQTFVPKTQYESLALAGMTRYLTSYEAPHGKDGMKITGFTIDSISACALVTDNVQCNVEYSIHPVDKLSQSVGIDTGRISRDGWILRKYGVVLLRLSANNLYEVWSFADGHLQASSK